MFLERELYVIEVLNEDHYLVMMDSGTAYPAAFWSRGSAELYLVKNPQDLPVRIVKYLPTVGDYK